MVGYAQVFLVFTLCLACSTAYPYVSEAPTVESPGYGTLEVTVNFGKENPIVGDAKGVSYYIVQYRKEGDPWKDYAKVGMPEVEEMKDGYTRKFTITGLESGEVFNVRVLLADGKMNSYDGEDVPYYIAGTMCYLPEEYDYHVASTRKKDSLSFSWTYENQDERWCPILNYQVWWTTNGTWEKLQTPESEFQIPNFDPMKALQFKVRTLTTGVFAPFSETVNYTPSDIDKNSIVDLKVKDITSSSVVLTWKFSGSEGKQPKSFLIQVEELEVVLKEKCCQVFPNLEIPVEKKLSTYEVKLKGLQPTAKYQVTVSVAPAESGDDGARTITFTTPPPPLPVEVPKVKVNTRDKWSWIPQTTVDTDSHSYKQFIKHYLLLVLPENEDPALQSGITHDKLNKLLKEELKKNFFVASLYKLGEDITLEDGRRGWEEWGSYHNQDLATGSAHRLAAVQVTEIGDTLAADVALSTPFTAAP